MTPETQANAQAFIEALLTALAIVFAQAGITKGKLVIWGWDVFGWLQSTSPDSRKVLVSGALSLAAAVGLAWRSGDWYQVVVTFPAFWTLAQGTFQFKRLVPK